MDKIPHSRPLLGPEEAQETFKSDSPTQPLRLAEPGHKVLIPSLAYVGA